MSPSAHALTVVVVTHEHERELPRTLQSLRPPYQRGISDGEVEIIVVDNGSERSPADYLPREVLAAIRLIEMDDPSVSPARAANVGLAAAHGDLVGLIIDGARLASPGLLAAAQHAARTSSRAVVTAPAWHLGSTVQRGDAADHDQAAEDALLARTPWEQDGYELFTIATPAASSARGLFGPMGESSSLFLPRALWLELGGLDERFVLPGGGLVNHDLYTRACALEGASLVVLLGEGTFHQYHGGAATSGRISRDDMRSEYEALRGEPQRPPTATPSFFGAIPPQYLSHLATSIDLARERRAARSGPAPS